MNLVFTKHDPHKGCLKPAWDLRDPRVSWISLFLTDFAHGLPNGLSEYEVTRVVFDEFSKASVKQQSRIYASLEFPFANDYKAFLEELQTSSKEFVTERDIAAGKWKLWGLIKGRTRSGRILVSDAKWQDISHWYRNYDSWTMTCYRFLISDSPLQDWIEDLLTVRDRRLDVKFVEKVGMILLNHFEHGMEVVGLNLSPGPFENVARNLSEKLNLSLETRETPKGVALIADRTAAR